MKFNNFIIKSDQIGLPSTLYLTTSQQTQKE
ncbi:protein of unknown function [Candidatus Filomicrobium marinum]|uniref:Uncharacterized protein n=1 Tax=Candidatus Filomicrobium marinum TaxID=1608628 RepID=A0A0D6JAV7_9HYPH|nr:protein of unknown function [Candidatus Filomicrobium marinum]